MTERFRLYDFWRCDECDRLFPSSVQQHPLRVQQKTERAYGTEQVHRPIENLVVCADCLGRYRNIRP